MHTDAIEGYTFHYDNGLQGDTIIHNDGIEFCIPTEVLIEFAGRRLRNEAISKLEDQTGRDYLVQKLLGGLVS